MGLRLPNLDISSDGHSEFFPHGLGGRKGVFRNLFVVPEQATDVTCDRVAAHSTCFGKRASKSNEAGQSRNDYLVATLFELFEENSKSIVCHVYNCR